MTGTAWVSGSPDRLGRKYLDAPTLTLQVTLLAVLARSEDGVTGGTWTGPPGGLLRIAGRRTLPPMKKRIVSAFLWFYVGWYAGALIADIVGISPVLGPLLGAAAAALIVGDPRRLIWTARPMSQDNLPEPA